MTEYRNIEPTIWVHPNWARTLLELRALVVDDSTGKMFTTSGVWVGVDESLPVRGEFTRKVSYAVIREGAYGGT